MITPYLHFFVLSSLLCFLNAFLISRILFFDIFFVFQWRSALICQSSRATTFVFLDIFHTSLVCVYIDSRHL